MRKNLMITPEGTKDYLFEECITSGQIQEKIKKCFTDRGYSQVDTPCIEFYDLFSMEVSGYPQENMYKSTDNKGRLLVMRPDSTLPIARMASTRLKHYEMPLRLFYGQSVYRNNPTLLGKSNEIMQMGIELIGTTGKKADLEILTTAIDCLSSTVDDFRIEIGHAGFFNALTEKMDVDKDTVEAIRGSIESKNYSTLNNILDKINPCPEVIAIRKLPRLFGGEEVIEKALKLCNGTKAENSLQYLKELYNELSKLNLGDKITLDLGIVQKTNYYSGIVFTAYLSGIGDAVISGGRYDKLMSNFDFPTGAAGFAVNIDHLVEISLRDKRKNETPVPQILVCAEDGFEIKAIEETKRLVSKGKSAVFSTFENNKDAKDYAEKVGIKEIIIIGE
ncbi:MAG: ATP phosphoribosyltransferase regulatory subunit [Oscillospiraceae bacterium]|nr:ATP phosphoribosyltransferase regulatory subunit [Oscillospiraceae bacterium]